MGEYKIGIDIGGTDTKIGLVNEKQELVASKVIPTGAMRTPGEVIKDIGDATLVLLKEQGITASQCGKVGVGVPGLVDSKCGYVSYSNNIPWEQVPLAEELSKIISLPVKIANDADCAALGEVAAGGAKDCENTIMITLGTGVGGGVVIDGTLYQGRMIGGVEIGHTVIVADGAQCTCGRKGCLEAYASATAMKRMAREIMGQEYTPKEVFDMADEGHELAKKVVNEYIDKLGLGLVNIVNIFRPEMILIGGGISKQGEKLLAPIREKMKKECFGGVYSEIPKLGIATLGNDAGMIGAANL